MQLSVSDRVTNGKLVFTRRADGDAPADAPARTAHAVYACPPAPAGAAVVPLPQKSRKIQPAHCGLRLRAPADLRAPRGAARQAGARGLPHMTPWRDMNA